MARFKVVQEMEIPPELLRLPVNPVLIAHCGFPLDTPPDDLLLAQVVASAGRYGGEWMVNASVQNGGTTVTVGEIWCQHGTTRDEVLQVTDEWIRASEHITFVPGSFYEIQVPEDQAPYFVYGAILVRGDRI